MNRDYEDYRPFVNMRKIHRELKHEKRRMEFVEVRKAGGGAREKLRRKIGGFHQLHNRHIVREKPLLSDGY